MPVLSSTPRKLNATRPWTKTIVFTFLPVPAASVIDAASGITVCVFVQTPLLSIRMFHSSTIRPMVITIFTILSGIPKAVFG
jgi:hypothetical protein